VSGNGPLNYTTVIEPDKSAAECMAMLGKFGAKRAGIAYDEHRVPFGLAFVLATRWGDRMYELPVDFAATQRVLQRAYDSGNISRKFTEPAQGRRVAWRVIKDWLEAQLALIEAGLMDSERVMFPYMLVSPGQSLFTAYDEQQPAIGAGR
jgi:hypothetical protein